MQLDKITNVPKATRKRSFRDACGLSHALDLVGERWALHIVRELMLGPRRFGDLRADLPGLSANVLTQRLHELEARHIVERRKLPPPASVQVYGLTQWGHEAEPLVREMARWAARAPDYDPVQHVSRVAMLLSLGNTLHSERIAGADFSIGFRLGEHSYLGHIGPAGFTVARGDAAAGDVIFTGAASALATYIYGKRRTREELDARGGLRIEGDPALAERFAALFDLPQRFVPPPA